MKQIADLHIHSRFSMATSKDGTMEMLDLWARKKGITLIGTGDMTHPLWRQELKEKLIPAEQGLFRLKEEYVLPEALQYPGNVPRFVLSGEISSIYKKDGKTRKVHSLILLPGFHEADAFAARLEKIGNIHSDGRPILGLPCHDLLEIMLEVSEEGMYIPAHIWTPHFSLFGAKSGFDTIEECFGDLTPYNMEEEEPEEISRIHIIPSNGRIEFKNVDFHYEGPASPKVLNQLNFTVLPGKVNAIVGVSGSGKTTIMKLLLGYYHPSCGQISLNGKDLWDYSSRAWRGACGTVMQEGFIFSDTIERNICMQEGDVDKDRLKYALHVANIESYIDSLPLGLNTQIGMEGNGMSSGQKQRILIARAVYKNPDYILLDEATNSLDSNNEQLILERMQTFYQNKTVVVIAHRLSTIRHADNIIVLNNGQVAESGKHEELLARKGLYYELINKQLDV